MTMWQSGGMGGGGGHGSQNNPWMKLMGIVHKDRRITSDSHNKDGSNERNLNQWVALFLIYILFLFKKAKILKLYFWRFQILLSNVNKKIYKKDYNKLAVKSS